MARLAPSLSFALLASAACAGPAAPVPGAALRYRAVLAGPLVYVQADTVTIEVSAGGVSFDVDVLSAATWAMMLAPTPEGAREGAGEAGVRVVAALQDLDARIDNPLTGASRADESGVMGSLVFDLDPHGEASPVRLPAVEDAARQVFSAASVVHRFFPRLAGRPVAPGSTWTDTIHYTMDEAAGEVSASVVLSYTVAGDTTVEGRPHLLVRFRGTDRRRASGRAGGMAFTHDVAGPVEGSFLWDQGREVLRSLTRRSDLEGTMDVGPGERPLAVRVRGVTRIELRPSPPAPPPLGSLGAKPPGGAERGGLPEGDIVRGATPSANLLPADAPRALASLGERSPQGRPPRCAPCPRAVSAGEVLRVPPRAHERRP